MTNRRQLAFALFLLLFGILYTWALYAFFTGHDKGGNDFFIRYYAWREFLFKGRNPYSPEVTGELQALIFGGAARPGEAEVVYPLYAVAVQWPFLLLPWAWARAAYMVFCQFCIVAGLGLTAQLIKWKLVPTLFAVTALWAVLFYPEARGIILGQIVITQYLFAVLALWLLHEKRDALAGICLALTTVRPPAVYLFLPFVLVFAIARRRWRVVWAFALALAALLLGSFVALPSWLGDWLAQVARYPGYTVGQSPVWLLTHEATALGGVWEWLLTLTLVGLMGAAWWVALRATDEAAFHWALGVTLVISSLIVPRSATTNYIFLLLPLFSIFAALMRRWPRGGVWAVLAIQFVGFVGLWWLFAATAQGDQEQAIMFIPQPVIIGLALLFAGRWLIADHRRAAVTL